MKKILTIFTFIIFNLPLAIMAMEEIELGEIVVTATRTAERVENVASSVTVITAEDIEKRNAVTVLEVLRDVQGLDIVQNGGPGKKTSLFIRGGNSAHTLVMIDGVQVNSPTSGGYNFANLTVDNIEKIEIIRGPQSTLYGSDAMAGVVNVITKRGRGDTAYNVSIEGGSQETYRGNASISGGSKKLNYALAISNIETEGISAASEDNGNTEKDGYESITLSGRVGIEIDEKVDLDLAFRYIESATDLDAFGTDDLNYTQDSQSSLLSVDVIHTMSNVWSHTVKGSYLKEELKNKDPDASGKNSEITTAIKSFDWQHDLFLLDDTNTLTFGFEYEKQEGENDSAEVDKAIDNRGLYLQDQLSLLSGDLNLTVGGRRDNHSRFGDEDTYRLAASYLIRSSQTRIKGSYGTAFKAPTLNALFYNVPAVAVGDPNLKPEKIKGFDVGIEQSFMEKSIILSADYFYNDYDNLIEWVGWPMTPVNVTEAETKGWEFGVDVKPANDLHIAASWTITETEDKATGNELARRPENKGSLSIGWTPEKTSIHITLNKVGKRWDDSDNTDKLNSYTKVDLAFSYDITKNLTLFGRGENLLNEDYEEAKGYGTAGISYYGGLKANF